jgi:hypothetical protein
MSAFRCEWGLALLAVALPAAAQDSRRGIPEFNLYAEAGERTRFVFKSLAQEGPDESLTQGIVQAGFEVALRPLFRRALRHDPDVFRSRYLTFGAAYEYRAGTNQGAATGENRILIESNTREPLPLGFVIRDRNRGEFRFVHGQAFSCRYRNRLWVERDMNLGKVSLTPYVYDEVFFDGRFGSWTTNRTAIGIQFPVSNWVIEPYVFREHNSTATPRWLDAAGIKFSLYL